MAQYHFTPRLVPTLITLLLLPLLISLGMWQLHRAEYKRLLQAEYNARRLAPPAQISDIKNNLLTWRYQAVKVAGHFDNDHQILLDNKFYHHQAGYQVLTPLILTNSQKAVLVNRGWIPLGKDRQTLPFIKSVLGKQTLHGIIAIPDAKPFVLKNPVENPGQWPLRVQQVDIQQLAKIMGRELYPIIVLLAPEEQHGFSRDWQPVSMKPEVHTGYAVQWFAMALTLLVLYMIISIKRRD